VEATEGIESYRHHDDTERRNIHLSFTSLHRAANIGRAHTLSQLVRGRVACRCVCQESPPGIALQGELCSVTLVGPGFL